MVYIMNFKGIFSGTVIAIILVAISLFAGGTLVYYNLLSERMVSTVVFIAAVTGCFLGALGSGRYSESKILLNSMFVGVIFSVLLLIVSAIVNGGFEIHTRTLALMFSALAASFTGALFAK